MKSRLLLKVLLFIAVAFVSLNAYERVTYIETPKISTGIDNNKEMPLHITNTIPQNQKVIYASAYAHNALAEDVVIIKWYRFQGKKPILIKKEQKDATGYEFVYSSLASKKGKFAVGNYAVVFQVSLAKPKIRYFTIVSTSKTKHSMQDKYKHYDASKFKGHGKNGNEKIVDVALKKIKWNKKEQRVSLVVKTNHNTYRDDYIFCQKRSKYYYCSIEDDGGYIKLKSNMTMKLKVDFAQEIEGEEPTLAFHIEQKNKHIWIKPSAKIHAPKGKCFQITLETDKKLFHAILKKYSENISIDKVNKMEFARFYSPKYNLSFTIPANWKDITKEGDAIVYLLRSDESDVGKFMFRTITKFWDKKESKDPKNIIKRAAKLIAEISTEEANKSGDKNEPIGSLKLLIRNNKLVGHFVLHRVGAKTRWESYTLIWSGGKLYLLSVMGKDNELPLVEFLASLGVESFCDGNSRSE